jgi:hypothetical protein
MTQKIDRSVKIVRALADVQAQVQAESWSHDTARLAVLARTVRDSAPAICGACGHGQIGLEVR